MKGAKISKNLTACLSTLFPALWLAGCVNQPNAPEATFNRSEAVKARINLALAYLEQNDFPKAKQNIDKALEHDQHDYLPYSVLAYYYQQIGDQTAAENAYQQTLTLSQAQSNDNQPRPDVRNNYGTFLCQQGKFNAAYQQFELALQSKQPYYHQGDTLENMVLCAKQEKNQAKVEEALQQLEKLDGVRAAKLK